MLYPHYIRCICSASCCWWCVDGALRVISRWFADENCPKCLLHACCIHITSFAFVRIQPAICTGSCCWRCVDSISRTIHTTSFESVRIQPAICTGSCWWRCGDSISRTIHTTSFASVRIQPAICTGSCCYSEEVLTPDCWEGRPYWADSTAGHRLEKDEIILHLESLSHLDSWFHGAA